MEYSIFFQALKGHDRVNWVKGSFVKYYKNSAFGILTSLFFRANLPSTTQVLRYILVPSIKNITDNIYHYCPHHFTNGGPQVKGVDFYQSTSPVLVAPTLRLIVSIFDTYHLTIGISDITNALRLLWKALVMSKMPMVRW